MQSFERCVHRRLLVDVEAGVDQHRQRGRLRELADQAAVERTAVRVDALDARGIVDMNHRRHGLGDLRVDRERHHNEGRVEGILEILGRHRTQGRARVESKARQGCLEPTARAWASRFSAIARAASGPAAGAEDLLAWAGASLPLKNTLLEADARTIEAAFQRKLGQATLLASTAAEQQTNSAAIARQMESDSSPPLLRTPWKATSPSLKSHHANGVKRISPLSASSHA